MRPNPRSPQTPVSVSAEEDGVRPGVEIPDEAVLAQVQGAGVCVAAEKG